MKCFYHKSDLDGHCAGAIVLQKFPECEMIGVDYKSTVDFSTIEPNEPIFVVDFCFTLEEMKKLNLAAQLVWIDHHKSSIDMCKDAGYIGGLRGIGKAGCELTWEYLHSHTTIPEAVRLLGRHDVWDHSDEKTLPFQYGMRQHEDTRPESCIWSPFLSPSFSNDFTKGLVNATAQRGGIILNYENKQNAMYAKVMFYEKEFHGFRAIIINKANSNSKIFDSVYDPTKHDIMVLFGVKPNEWKYTLFCNKPEIDVSEIAIQYGGGGHKGAAGFYTTEQIV